MRVVIEYESNEIEENYVLFLKCPKCDLQLGNVLFDDEHEIDRHSLLKNDKFPNYCPLCGIKLEYEK